MSNMEKLFRHRFENWANQNPDLKLNLRKKKSGEYLNQRTRLTWLSWSSASCQNFTDLVAESVRNIEEAAFRGYLCRLSDLKLPDGLSLKGLSLTGYGSWRGSFAEPCLYISSRFNGEITAAELEEARINLLTHSFLGYKGDYFEYDESSPLHVEVDISSYTDGKHLRELMENFPDFKALVVMLNDDSN